MANQVVKKDGSKEPFDAEKVKKAIALAAGDAGLPAERASSVVSQVASVVLEFAASKEEISAIQLKEKILGELDKIEPAAAAAWRKYDQERSRS